MNNFFNPIRFGRLLRAHWAEKRREYAWFVAVLVMLDLVAMVFSFAKSDNSPFNEFQFRGQATWYMTGLFFSALIFAGRYFQPLLNPGTSLITLMRPASVFEKWLMAFLFISIFYPLVYTLLYTLFNYPAVQLAKSMVSALPACENCTYDFRFYFPLLTTDIEKTGAYNPENSFKSQVFFFLLLSAAQAHIAGGTAFFKRSPVLRTVLGTFLLFCISMGLGWAPQLGIFATYYGEDAIQHTALEYIVSIAMWLGLPLLLWTVLFFHIKERELA
ncbi:hypothetical protein [Undibacterium pigrum]|uniref:Uncharacterized protein n=1 Tax=Undibacterium pigrum TaxID=401470 RepID=A0A318IN68_9BURK|nr:hypothetical protein [Undibacterium pigrum]PXX34927.1 hypothetical protein DFR42_1246 [Undibacterium pigrum]